MGNHSSRQTEKGALKEMLNGSLLANMPCGKLALGAFKLSRFDSEGIDCLDLGASSHFIWVHWVRSLNGEDSALLNARLAILLVAITSAAMSCAIALFASARHFFSDCPCFAPDRLALQERFNIRPDWWPLQTRVESCAGFRLWTSSP